MQLRSSVFGLIIILFAPVLLAGPLNPPAGPVTDSKTSLNYKTLADIEPRIAINDANTPGDANTVYKITQPGSYYLTANVIGTGSKHGISVYSADVTIDLNGFSLIGPGGGTGNGVLLTGGPRCTIRNGGARAWGGCGIHAGYRWDCMLDGITAHENGQGGIWVGNNAQVRNCTAKDNAQQGILTASNCIVLNCIVKSNGAQGISAAQGTTVKGCASSENAGVGIAAIQNCTITECTSVNNVGSDFEVLDGSRASQCVAKASGSYGFRLGASSRLTDCTSDANAVGAVRVVGSNADVSRCTLAGVAGFPVVSIDAVNSARVSDNNISGGTFAIAGASATSGLVTGNQCVGQSSGAFSLGATCQVGPVVSATSTITSTSPFANFVR